MHIVVPFVLALNGTSVHTLSGSRRINPLLAGSFLIIVATFLQLKLVKEWIDNLNLTESLCCTICMEDLGKKKKGKDMNLGWRESRCWREGLDDWKWGSISSLPLERWCNHSSSCPPLLLSLSHRLWQGETQNNETWTSISTQAESPVSSFFGPIPNNLCCQVALRMTRLNPSITDELSSNNCPTILC